MAPATDAMPTSCFDQLVAALGKMLGGGMIPEGETFDLGSGTFALASIQAILVEVECPLLVFGLSVANDSSSTFLAMSDGSIWRTKFVVSGGDLVWSAWKSNEEECTEFCTAADLYSEGIKALVTRELAKKGKMIDGDSIQGHINTDCHAAICMRMKGNGKFIMTPENGYPREGVAFTIDAPRPNADFDETLATLVIKPMTEEEIAEEVKLTKKSLGMDYPFPTNWGQA